MTGIASDTNLNAADHGKYNLLISKARETRLAAAFKFFRSAGIEPVLIKGWAAARNYPSEVTRHFSDIDLAVAADDFNHARRLINAPEAPRLGIDLHRELRHLDSLPWNLLIERSQLAQIDGDLIRVLSPEDHLRVICVHWLTDGGALRERLWDIYFAVANRPPGFDWDHCLGVVSPVRRRWIVCTIGLTHKYLDLPINDLPFADEAIEIPTWLPTAVEKEWASDIRLRGLETCLRDPRAMLQQIRKRIPPNAVQATIEMEGDFDRATQWQYQLRSFLWRIPPSLRRIGLSLIGRNWRV